MSSGRLGVTLIFAIHLFVCRGLFRFEPKQSEFPENRMYLFYGKIPKAKNAQKEEFKEYFSRKLGFCEQK